MAWLLALVVPETWPEKAAWGTAIALLFLHLGLRVRAQRLAVDEEGKPAPFRLRLWPMDRYRGEEGARALRGVFLSGFLFAVAAMVSMLLSYMREP